MSEQLKQITVFEHEGRIYRTKREWAESEFRTKVATLLRRQVTMQQGWSGQGQPPPQMIMDVIWESDILEKADELIDLLKQYKAALAEAGSP